MKPIKALYPVSLWLMRIGLLLFAYTGHYNTFIKFNFGKGSFYVSAIFLIAAVLIFISGFLRKATLAVVSGLALTLISIYKIIVNLDGGLNSDLVIYILIASIAFLF